MGRIRTKQGAMHTKGRVIRTKQGAMHTKGQVIRTKQTANAQKIRHF